MTLLCYCPHFPQGGLFPSAMPALSLILQEPRSYFCLALDMELMGEGMVTSSEQAGTDLGHWGCGSTLAITEWKEGGNRGWGSENASSERSIQETNREEKGEIQSEEQRRGELHFI